MTTDMSTLATKTDLQMVNNDLKGDIHLLRVDCDDFKEESADFRDETNRRFNRLEQRLYDFEIRANERNQEIIGHMHTHEQNIKLYFETAVENFRHDMRDVKNDRVSSLEDRVKRLEHRTASLSAA